MPNEYRPVSSQPRHDKEKVKKELLKRRVRYFWYAFFLLLLLFDLILLCRKHVFLFLLALSGGRASSRAA
jgi:hypothetical protein